MTLRARHAADPKLRARYVALGRAIASTRQALALASHGEGEQARKALRALTSERLEVHMLLAITTGRGTTETERWEVWTGRARLAWPPKPTAKPTLELVG